MKKYALNICFYARQHLFTRKQLLIKSIRNLQPFTNDFRPTNTNNQSEKVVFDNFQIC